MAFSVLPWRGYRRGARADMSVPHPNRQHGAVGAPEDALQADHTTIALM